MTGSDAERVVLWLIELPEGQQYPALDKRIADGAEAEGLAVTPLVPESLLAEAEELAERNRNHWHAMKAERDALQAQVDAVRVSADRWERVVKQMGGHNTPHTDAAVMTCLTEIRSALGE